MLVNITSGNTRIEVIGLRQIVIERHGREFWAGIGDDICWFLPDSGDDGRFTTVVRRLGSLFAVFTKPST